MSDANEQSADSADEDLPPYVVPLCEEEPQILYADEHLMFVEKPAFLLSVPGRHRLNKDCLITRLQKEHPTATIVHRLDLDTSGIMVIPLCREVHSDISRQFQRREVYKNYVAVVYGLPAEDSGEVDLPIAVDWANRPLQKICHENGKPAFTRYTVIERDATSDSARLLLEPVTGRSHQLRIHLAEIGHPILGCDMYAHEEALARSERLLLHAQALRLTHPITRKEICIQSAVPF